MSAPKLEAIANTLRSNQDLPASSILTYPATQTDSGEPTFWNVCISPGSNEGWYIEAYLQAGRLAQLVMSIRVDGGLDEATTVLEATQEALWGQSPADVLVVGH